jgi:hypothetical protein
MKFQVFIEKKSLKDIYDKKINRGIKRWCKIIDQEKNKEIKSKNKIQTSIDTSSKSSEKKSVYSDIRYFKSLVKDQKSFLEIIPSLEQYGVSSDVMNFIKSVSGCSDKLATNKNPGTRLISKNKIIASKILDHPLIQKNSDDKRISDAVARLTRISNSNLNSKSDNRSFKEFSRSINNSLFNSIRDLVFELIKVDIMSQKEII